MMLRLSFLIFVRYFFTTVLLCSFFLSKSQTRSNLIPALAPFYHGVASGDPTASAVIIWTRLTITDPSANVTWRVATDTGMVNIVKTGTTITDANRDFIVKIDVTGLIAGTTYYYEFESNNKRSLRGRTKTAPLGPVSNVRLALVSCSNYAEGYFNAYKAIKDRNDVDAVIHLGDYIYEYGNGEYGTLFMLMPPTEMVTLADYRLRHNYYNQDSNLLRLRQQFAFITVWDDHESANDSYKNGAENHTEGAEGNWPNRKAISIKAYREWMPIRDAGPTEVIYRNYQYGNLADLICLDTRLIGRDLQLANPTPGVAQDSLRQLMGTTQLSWFQNRMNTTTAQWKIIAQQVMVAPLNAGPVPINMDQWDGYEGERRRLYNIIAPKNDVVVLTGDIHTSWANELPGPLYLPGTPLTPCQNSMGVEYVVTSVTSPGLDQLQGLGGPTAIMAGNPHMKYVELASHGFGLLDITPARAQHEWYFVSTITSPVFTTSFAKAFAAASNQKCLTEVTTPSIAPPEKITTMAPGNPRPGSVILPVRFLQLGGAFHQNSVMLNWLTGSQSNCSHYSIERSADGIAFQNIGLSNCNTTNKYSFVDNQPLNGNSCYRIVMMGVDGSKTISTIIKLSSGKAAIATTNWYPNPTVNKAICEVTVPADGTYTLQIMSSRGAVVQKKIMRLQAGTNYIPVNVTSLPKGLLVYDIYKEGVSQKLQGAFIKL